MPMRFDLEGLREHARMLDVDTHLPMMALRQPTNEACLRIHKHPIEPLEVKTGKPWDEWGAEEQKQALELAGPAYSLSNPLLRSFMVSQKCEERIRREGNR